LTRLGELAGGMDYAAVSVAVRRFGERIARNSTLRRKLDEIERAIVEY
jgi:hypothetical protein